MNDRSELVAALSELALLRVEFEASAQVIRMLCERLLRLAGEEELWDVLEEGVAIRRRVRAGSLERPVIGAV